MDLSLYMQVVGNLIIGLYPISILFSCSLPVPTGPPQDLAVADRTSTFITLTWRDPAPDRINDRGGATGFEVRRNKQRVTTVTDRTYIFTELTAATSYGFEVLAINEQGNAHYRVCVPSICTVLLV